LDVEAADSRLPASRELTELATPGSAVLHHCSPRLARRCLRDSNTWRRPADAFRQIAQCTASLSHRKFRPQDSHCVKTISSVGYSSGSDTGSSGLMDRSSSGSEKYSVGIRRSSTSGPFAHCPPAVDSEDNDNEGVPLLAGSPGVRFQSAERCSEESRTSCLEQRSCAAHLLPGLKASAAGAAGLCCQRAIATL